jgi:hypothetical protein
MKAILIRVHGAVCVRPAHWRGGMEAAENVCAVLAFGYSGRAVAMR